MLHDLRRAIRLVLHDMRFTVAAIVVLALGVGINTFGFSIVNAIYFRSLPFVHPDRLFMVSWETGPNRNVDPSVREFLAWQSSARSFEGVAAFRTETVTISDEDHHSEEVTAAALSSNAFPLLGLTPSLGRPFGIADDAGDMVVILGNDLWRTRYDGDETALGRAIRLNGATATIIGVMPEGLAFPERAQLWFPLPTNGATAAADDASTFGRIRADVDPRAAEAELQMTARGNPALFRPQSDTMRVALQTFTESFVGGVGPSLFGSIFAIATFVLVIACANLANLLLVRAIARSRDVAVRLAVGATRARMVRQLLVEILPIAAAGGAIGLGIAYAGARAFAAGIDTGALPYWIHFDVEPRVAAYVVLICGMVTLAVGLVPAFRVTAKNEFDALREAGRTSHGSPSTRGLRTA